MKTIIEGKNIENRYSVDHKWKTVKNSDGEDITVYTAKPSIVKDIVITGYEKLCEYDGEPHYNDKHRVLYGGFSKSLNISENEEAYVCEEIFRADKNEMHIHTDKVCSEKDVDLEDSENIYKVQTMAFNKMMIESNKKMNSYCELHKLIPDETDCIELFSLLYPESCYEIADGVMREKKNEQLLYVTSANSHNHACFSNGTLCTDSIVSVLSKPISSITGVSK